MTSEHRPVSENRLHGRADDLYCQSERQNQQAVDRMFAVIMGIQWAVTVVTALLSSSHIWPGDYWSTQLHVHMALLVGSCLTALPVYMAVRHPGSPQTRHLIAVAQACFSCLLIHVCGGRLETHFHIFGSLAFLAAYRDWRVLMSASLIIVVDHFARGVFWPQSVFGVIEASPWRSIEHSLWIAFVDVFLVIGCIRGRRELHQFAWRTAEMESSIQSSEEQTRRLHQERVIRESLIAHSHDAIVTIDTRGRITGWNRQAEATFGWTIDEATGVKCETLFIPRNSDSDGHNCFAWVSQHRTPRLNERIQTTVWNRDREEVLVDLTFIEFGSENERQYFAFIKDISDLKRSEELLEEARHTAELNSQLKTQFLTDMSHELRTPLTAILGFTHVLRHQTAESQQMTRDEILDEIESSGNNLLDLLNDLFDLTRIESGQIAIIRNHCDPQAIISEALESFLIPAQSKGLSLESRWSGRQPTSVRTDPLRLTQILNNLLSNAVKFTESGSVEVEARLESSDHRPAQLVITVRDTGVGISEDCLERIFQPFEQIDGETTRLRGGTGLGLTVSRRLAQELNGDLTVESRVGYGTVFTLSVETGTATFGPIESAADHEHSSDKDSEKSTSSADSKPDLTGLRVLLCEDKPENHKLLEFLITSAGGDVVLAVNGREGVSLALEKDFDLIIMDMHMPVMDGYEATRQLRSAGVEIPIVALTAHTVNGAKDRSMEAGCTHFVTKPFNPRQLLGQVNEFISKTPLCETP